MAESFSRYDVYTVTGSIYCYRDTNVLRNRLAIRDNQQLRIEDFISHNAYYRAELNYIHPFQEGNGRSSSYGANRCWQMEGSK